ncbi:uroporphyrinogen-III synthase [Blattabacterium sp. (Mastotermes darwiniensis) str. MADAR]|jgi:uroporphyrinogen-III synthase|nr:uroporphyrinogen-III synthase [Blattabacterium sp. (Mastotermes darwiniensis) str. MADAR]
MTKSVDYSSFSKRIFFVKSCDFLSVKYCILDNPPLNDQIIFTSCNGVKGFIYNFGINILKKKKFYVVGDKTYSFLRKNCGIFSLIFRKNYVQDLMNVLFKKKSNQSYDWFCGKKSILKNQCNYFHKKNIFINRYEVYQTFFIPHRIKNLSSYHGIIFFSPSGAKSFFIKNKIQHNSKTEFFAIGKTTAEFVSKFLNRKKIWIPDQPSLKEILFFVRKFFEKNVE